MPEITPARELGLVNEQEHDDKDFKVGVELAELEDTMQHQARPSEVKWAVVNEERHRQRSSNIPRDSGPL